MIYDQNETEMKNRFHLGFIFVHYTVSYCKKEYPMIEVILRAFGDLFNKKILLTSLIPIAIAAAFWGIVFFIFHTNITSFVTYLVGHIPFIGNKSWVKDLVEAAGGILIYYELLIITSVMIVGVIADKIVDEINAQYYYNDKMGFGSVMESILISLKQNVIFMVLFILFIPAMFVPVLNILVHLFLWVVLIKKPTFYDSIAMYATRDEFNTLQNTDKTTLTLITILSASLFLIPVIGIFVYIVQLLLFAHFNLKRLQTLRTEVPYKNEPKS